MNLASSSEEKRIPMRAWILFCTKTKDCISTKNITQIPKQNTYTHMWRNTYASLEFCFGAQDCITYQKEENNFINFSIVSYLQTSHGHTVTRSHGHTVRKPFCIITVSGSGVCVYIYIYTYISFICILMYLYMFIYQILL